ncbi:hypothetical protein AHF37_02136 [Paragonimus kellicotti]|nr:hypothetical protein AHF37_02136 [Paragonimus kellicotti]
MAIEKLLGLHKTFSVNPSPTATTNLFPFSLGVIISCFTIQSSFVGVLITYSLVKGAGISFGYSVVIAVAATWFPARRGLVVGLIVGGFGLGPLIFAPIQKAFINPENVKVNEETNCLSIELSAEQAITKTKANNNATKKKTTKAATDQSRSPTSPSVPSQSTFPPVPVSVPSSAPPVVVDEENIPPKEVLRCPNFYLLWVVMFCNIIPTTILTSAYKYFGQKLIQDDQFLTAVAATSSVFNAGGRVLWGLIIDKLSFKMPLCILLILWASFLVTFPHIGLTEGTLLQGLYFFWVCAMFFLLSGIFTIMPAATSTLFGPVNLAVNYGMLFTAFALGSLVCAGVSSAAGGDDPYLYQFTGCGCACIIALLVTIWIEDKKMHPKLNALGSLVCAGVSSAAGGDDPYLYQFTGCGCACIIALLVTIWIEDKKMHPKLNVFRCFTGQCTKRPTEPSQC